MSAGPRSMWKIRGDAPKAKPGPKSKTRTLLKEKAQESANGLNLDPAAAKEVKCESDVEMNGNGTSAPTSPDSARENIVTRPGPRSKKPVLKLKSKSEGAVAVTEAEKKKKGPLAGPLSKKRSWASANEGKEKEEEQVPESKKTKPGPLSMKKKVEEPREEEKKEEDEVPVVERPRPGPKSKKAASFSSNRNSNSSGVQTPSEPDFDNAKKFKLVSKPGPKSKKVTVVVPVKEEKKEGDNGDSASEAETEPVGEVYEVEDVLDYVVDNKLGPVYKVKWKGYENEEDQTWEPPENLHTCEDALFRFYLKRKEEVEEQIRNQTWIVTPSGKRRKSGPKLWKIPPDPRPRMWRIEEYLEQYPLDEGRIGEFYNKLARKKWNRTRLQDSKFDKYLTDAMDGKFGEGEGDEGKHAELRKELYFLEAEERKKELDKTLKKWQKDINSVTEFMPTIVVENDVDLEGPPEFKFVADYVSGEGVSIPADPPIGCQCSSSCYDSRKNCCSSLSSAEFAYNRFKKLAVEVGRPIYECNKKCPCEPDCINRVVQYGKTPDLKLGIFKTANGCGWGAKTITHIKKGTFVCLYLGEVIMAEEGERRAKEGRGAYLLDLDFNDFENPTYSIDAQSMGNISHFINHSCDPNLGVWNVWVDCLDPNLPKVAMFAIRDIPRGEELTFDYQKMTSGEEDGEDSSASPSKGNQNQPNAKQMECKCGAKKCRKYIYPNAR